MEKLKNNKIFIYLFVVSIAIFLVVFASDKISFILSVFAPVLYGVVIAYLMDGIVRFFAKRLKMHRNLAIVVSFVLVLGIGSLVCYYTIPFLINTVKDLVSYISRLLTQHNTGMYMVIEGVAKFFNIELASIQSFDITKIVKNAEKWAGWTKSRMKPL